MHETLATLRLLRSCAYDHAKISNIMLDFGIMMTWPTRSLDHHWIITESSLDYHWTTQAFELRILNLLTLVYASVIWRVTIFFIVK